MQGRADDVSVADVKGAARLNGEFDNLKLAKIAGGVSFKSARTDMEFSRLDGDLDMDSGDMRASDLSARSACSPGRKMSGCPESAAMCAWRTKTAPSKFT